MLEGALILLAGLIIGRFVPGRRRGPKPYKPKDEPRPICGCGHHFSFHSPADGVCFESRHSYVPGAPLDLRTVAAHREQPIRPTSGGRRIMADAIRASILDEISQERDRQIAKWGEQHHPDDTGGWALNVRAKDARRACQAAAQHVEGGPGWRLILDEEVAEALAETDRVKLRDELIQVAAVAVAWVEDIQSRAVAAD